MGKKEEKRWKVLAITFMILFLISVSFLSSYIFKQDEQPKEKNSSLEESELDERYETECKYDICSNAEIRANTYYYDELDKICYCYAYVTDSFGDLNSTLVYKKYMEQKD